MIGITWSFENFWNSVYKISNHTAWSLEDFIQFTPKLDRLIYKIFIDDLKGYEVDIIREALRCIYENNEIPSQCMYRNEELHNEGNTYYSKNKELKIIIVNWKREPERSFCRLVFKDDERRTWMTLAEINQCLEDYDNGKID